MRQRICVCQIFPGGDWDIWILDIGYCVHLDKPVVDPDHDVVLGGGAGPEQEAVGGGDAHPQVDGVGAAYEVLLDLRLAEEEVAGGGEGRGGGGRVSGGQPAYKIGFSIQIHILDFSLILPLTVFL